MRTTAEKYDGIIFARCPAELPELVEFVPARARMTSLSSYVRAAVLEQLQRDGYRQAQTRSLLHPKPKRPPNDRFSVTSDNKFLSIVFR